MTDDLQAWRVKNRWDTVMRVAVVVLFICLVLVAALLYGYGKQNEKAIEGLKGLNDEQGESIDVLCVNRPDHPACQWAEALPEPEDVVEEAVPGAPGLPGTDGAPGADGRDGRDGRPGRDGEPGEDGRDGASGEPGEPGEGGVPGPRGPAGEDGQDGQDGAPGQPGQDGVSITSISADCIEGDPAPGDDVLRFVFVLSNGTESVHNIPLECGVGLG